MDLHVPSFVVAERLVALAAEAHDLHPRWTEIASRSSAIGRDFDSRSAGDEAWIDDLGLRQSPAPNEYFVTNAVRIADAADALRGLSHSDHLTRQLAGELGMEVDVPAMDYAVLAEVAVTDPGIVGQVLTCWTNHFGSWEDARELASALMAVASDLPEGDAAARLLTLAGNVLAGSGDERCRELYRHALARWTHPMRRLFVRFRLAVAEVKRLGAPERIGPALAAADRELTVVARDCPPGDAAAARALLNNLRALVYVKGKDAAAAEAAVRHAWESLKDELPTSPFLPKQAVDEFRIQVLANLGLVTGLRSGWDEALAIFEQADVIARRQQRLGFLVETGSLVGYALTRLERFEEALDVLAEAEECASRDVTPVRQRHVWKLLAVAADGAGRQAAADEWLVRLVTAA